MGRKRSDILDITILDELSKKSPQSMSDLRSKISKHGIFSGSDMAAHEGRPNEPKWHSDLSNSLNIKRTVSLVARGLVDRLEYDSYSISQNGKQFIDKFNELSNLLSDD